MSDDLDYTSMPAFHLAPDSSATVGGCDLLKSRLKTCKQAALAAELGIDPGQLSHILAGKFGIPVAKLGVLLAALGLKLVDAEARVIEQQDFDALARMAGQLLTQAPHAMLKG